MGTKHFKEACLLLEATRRVYRVSEGGVAERAKRDTLSEQNETADGGCLCCIYWLTLRMCIILLAQEDLLDII